MFAILGVAVCAVGLSLIAHALIVLTNFRGVATRRWYSLYDPRDGDDPIFQSLGLRVRRSVAAGLELLVGAGSLAIGGLLLAGSIP